jgi:hypothetical protein
MVNTREVNEMETENESEESKEELQAKYFEKIKSLRAAEAQLEKIKKEKETQHQK